MAEQASKKVEKNNVEETSESETKTEESSASQDETSDTTRSSDKSPSKKTKSPVKATKGKKDNKKKEADEDDESSDDEELVGVLDAPLVVQGKRVRRSTEFLSNTIKTPQSVERKKIEIPEGKGETLGSMARVQFQLQRIPGEELKPLHRILFGRPGNASEVKRNIRLFNGFDIEKGSKEYKKKEEQVDRFTQDSIKRLCEILDIEKKGTKEDILERVMDFLLCPKASGKPVPTKPTKKGSSSKKSSKKRKRPAAKKEEKSKTKKAKSDETVESDGDSEGEEDKEEVKEEVKEKPEKPPAKKVKSPKKEKKETKKTAKKDKKVVSIKISPGKKAKKAKEKKVVDSGDSSDEEPLSKKAKKSPPTNEEIVELVKELLDGADLEKITMKAVCKQVYERFPGFDLTDRKEFIKDSVKEIIT